jgi:hypothetical protein
MKEHMRSKASDNAVYGLGFIGALIFYISHATSLWTGIVGILKAMVWPAVLVYDLLTLLSQSL